MNIPSNLKYTQNDEWIQVEGNVGTIGITDFAQNQLSDIVFVEIVVGVGDMVKRAIPLPRSSRSRRPPMSIHP